MKAIQGRFASSVFMVVSGAGIEPAPGGWLVPTSIAAPVGQQVVYIRDVNPSWVAI